MTTMAQELYKSRPLRLSARLTDHDLYLFNEGNHYRMSDKLGARLVTVGRRSGSELWRLGAQRP